MNSMLSSELERLDAEARLRVAQELIASVASQASSERITEEQRVELRERLAHFQEHPDESPVSFAEIEARLGLA